MELASDGDEFVGVAKLAHNFPQSVSADCVQGVGEIHKGVEEVTVLFHTLFLKLAGGKYQVDRSFTCAEAALALREETLLQMVEKAVEQPAGEDLASNTEKEDIAMIVARMPVSFALVHLASLNSWGSCSLS